MNKIILDVFVPEIGVPVYLALPRAHFSDVLDYEISEERRRETFAARYGVSIESMMISMLIEQVTTPARAGDSTPASDGVTIKTWRGESRG